MQLLRHSNGRAGYISDAVKVSTLKLLNCFKETLTLGKIIGVEKTKIYMCTSIIFHWYGAGIDQFQDPRMHISHNASFRTEMCTFLFWMEHCGIWNWCILGFVNKVNWIFRRKSWVRLSYVIKPKATDLITREPCHHQPLCCHNSFGKVQTENLFWILYHSSTLKRPWLKLTGATNQHIQYHSQTVNSKFDMETWHGVYLRLRE